MARKTGAPSAIVIGGLTAGALDILAAFAINHTISPVTVLQAVASGLAGPAAFQGGASTAALGLACHFALSLVFAGVFVVAAMRAPRLLRHPLLAGFLYGALVYGIMTWIVVPVSASPIAGPEWPGMLWQVAAHVLLFGPAIAIVAARRLR